MDRGAGRCHERGVNEDGKGVAVPFKTSSFASSRKIGGPTKPGTALATFAGNTDYYAATAGVTYAMTPFISAGLGSTFSERAANHLITLDNVFTASLNYRPY
jgi:hypothetical protein